MPTVTGLKSKNSQGNGPGVMHVKQGSVSNVEITGSDLALEMSVKVIMGPNDQGIRWYGKLDSTNGTVYKSRITCTNPWDKGGGSDEGGAVGLGTGGGEGDDISVTVGSSASYTPPKTDVPIDT